MFSTFYEIYGNTFPFVISIMGNHQHLGPLASKADVKIGVA
jgi:hypothetical protein